MSVAVKSGAGLPISTASAAEAKVRAANKANAVFIIINLILDFRLSEYQTHLADVWFKNF